jgi:hypothetical protein
LDEVKFRHLELTAVPIDIDAEPPEHRRPFRLVGTIAELSVIDSTAVSCTAALVITFASCALLTM